MNKPATDLKEGLASIKKQLTPFVAERVESTQELIITVPSKKVQERFFGPPVFFLELRHCIRATTGIQDWAIRYASQVQNPLLPMLHSASTLSIIIDPMLPYRNPMSHLKKFGSLSLFIVPSRGDYFHSMKALAEIDPTNFNKFFEKQSRNAEPNDN